MSSEIPKGPELEHQVFQIQNAEQFEQIALDVYKFQYSQNKIYNQYCTLLNRTPDAVQQVGEIPFLPISFFKTHQVTATDFHPEAVFTSSGTTGSSTSRHFVKSLLLYEKSFFPAFERYFGTPDQYCIIGLLPSYLERQGSSLIYMVDKLITASNHDQSGFYLYDFKKLHDILQKLEQEKQATILLGVSYALLDFAAAYPMELKQTKVLETGGMKGRKTEMTKDELFTSLRNAFELENIYSEYGMTELLSQAYAVDGRYTTPPWMKVMLRDATDPFTYDVQTGAVNIIDLANIYSCSFIATDDSGKCNDDGTVSILGRIDNSDIRGCSQLIT